MCSQSSVLCRTPREIQLSPNCEVGQDSDSIATSFKRTQTHLLSNTSNNAYMNLDASPPTLESTGNDEEVELTTMTLHEDETSAEAPLISGNREPEHEIGDDVSLSTGSLFVWALTISACVSGLLFGYDTGVISSTLVSIGTDLSHHNLTVLDKGLITSCTSALALIASPIAGVFADKVGRKIIIMFADILFIVGALWQALTNTVWGMIFGRSVVGLAIGAASLITPLYISELAPSHLRGRLVTVSLLFITGGQVVAYVVGWMYSTVPSGWRWMVGLGAAPAVVQVAMLIFMPETPRYLCKADRESEAEAVLTRVYHGMTSNLDAVVSNIIRAVNAEIDSEHKARSLSDSNAATKLPATLQSLLFHPPHRRALIITCLLQGLQQLCGFNSLMYFSATIFSLLNFSSPTLTSLSIASTNFVFTIVAFNLIDRLGRRRSLLLTIPVMAVALLLVAISFSFTDINLPNSDTTPTTQPPEKHSRAPAIAILVSLILYVSSYATALGPVPWAQSELFPLSVRSLGSSLATATNWFSNTLVGLTFLPMIQALTPRWTFVLYAVVCAVGWLGVYCVYPETMGLGLEEVGELLKDGFGVEKSLEIVKRRKAGKSVATQSDEDG
jgi:MFS transporter, SP family, solute carrier family 2 (myo-inositol transporter), member 13